MKSSDASQHKVNLGRHLLPVERAALGAELTLLRRSNNGRTPHSAVHELAARFGVSKRTVRRIARRFEKAEEAGDLRQLETKHRSGRPSKVNETLLNSLREYAAARRFDFTWEEAAASLGGVSASTLRRAAKKEGWRTVYNRILPLLTDEHKKKRLAWAEQHRRQLWHDWVELDEKWFYAIVRRKRKVPPGEKVPASKCQSRRFIGKVMFLSAVAKPRPEYGFDGKIGIWRICEKKEAKRSSKNRPKGAVVTQDVEITAAKFLELLRTTVVPAVRRKMPWATSVTIQFDGPRAHVGGGNMAVFQKLGKRAKTTVDFVVQPPQSPDTNVLDLGVFNHLQTKVDKSKREAAVWDLDTLVEAVKSAFRGMESSVLESLYDTKTRVLGEIIRCGGDNDFVVPHH